MSGKWRLRTSLPILAGLISLSLLFSSPEVAAHGTIDQSFEGPFFGYEFSYSLAEDPIGQSFMPKLPLLKGVSVRLQNLDPKSGTTVAMLIKSGSIFGPQINTGANFKSAPIPAGMPEQWVHFELCSPVSVTPEQTYVIQLADTRGDLSGVVWLTGNNLYPRGTSIVEGVSVDDFDLGFQTYYIPQATRARIRITDSWASSDPAGAVRIDSVRRGDSFYAQIQYSVDRLNPGDAEFYVRTLASLKKKVTRSSCPCTTGDLTGRQYHRLTVPSGFRLGSKQVIVEAWVYSLDGGFNLKRKTFSIEVLP